MDFKKYVKMMLEAEKAKDQDEEKAKDQEDSDEDDTDDDDEEEQSSVKTGCTGSEASCDTEDEDEDEDEEDSDDDEEDSDDDEDDKNEDKKEKKGLSLKESMIYSSKYISGNTTSNVMTEETRVLVEGIKDNSASKYLAKLAKKAEKEAARYTKKGASEAAKTSKKAASALKEASNKIYKCETRYQAGDVTAKREYKQLCKQYSKELKGLGKTAKGLKGLLFTLAAGTVLLGAIGTTVAANANADGGIVNKIETAMKEFKSGNTKQGLKYLGDVAENDKNFVKSIISGDKFEGTDFAGKVADVEAKKAGWADAAERYKYTEEGLGGAIKKGKQTMKDFADGFGKYYKGASEVFEKTAKGAAEAARK